MRTEYHGDSQIAEALHTTLLRMPIVGQVSMDATQIDCSNHKSLREGDFVQFIGDQVSLDEVARLAGTIPYEILTGLGARIQRC